MTTEELRLFVVSQLGQRLELLGYKGDDVTPELDLFAAGLIDSMAFIEMLSAIEERFGVEMSLDDVEPEEIYSVEGLVRHASRRS